MAKSLSQNWWLVVLRGILAILFGVLAFVWPQITWLTLIVMFGVYAIVDGIVAIVSGLARTRESSRWWVFLIEGLIGIGAGIVALVWPGVTSLVTYLHDRKLGRHHWNSGDCSRNPFAKRDLE